MLRNKFPLARGTRIPLTPRTPVELQAALLLPEVGGRLALLRTLDFFGATRIAGPAGADGADDDDRLDVPYGVGEGAPRQTLRVDSASLDDLAAAAAACLAEATLNQTAMAEEGASGEISLSRVEAGVQAGAPQGAALVEWVDETREEMASLRRWREGAPHLVRVLRPRACATAMASHLLSVSPERHGVRAPLSAARAEQLIQWLEKHAEEEDELPAVLDVLAALEANAPRASVEALVDRLYSWIRLGEGLVME